MKQPDQNRPVKRISKLLAHFNYGLFWVNLACIIFLAMNYRQLFEYFQSTVTGLVSIITLVALLLTGKKYFDLKTKSFEEIFSSAKSLIPNVIIFAIVIFLTVASLIPNKQKINFNFKNSARIDFLEPAEFILNIKLYYSTNENDSLLLLKNKNFEFTTGMQSANEIMMISKPAGAYKYFLKINFENKYERLNLKLEPAELSANFDTGQNVNIKLAFNKQTFKLNLPPHLQKIRIEDISEFGTVEDLIRHDQDNVALLYGKYEYSLIDSLDNIRFKHTFSVNANSTPELKLPKNSTDVVISTGSGIITIFGSRYLGRLSFRNNKNIRLLNDEVYNYTLTAQNYLAKNGVLSSDYIDENGFITIDFAEADRKNSNVKFLGELDSGINPAADIVIDNEFIGTTDRIHELKYGNYSNIEIVFYDSLTNPGQIYKYIGKSENLQINKANMIISIPLKLELPHNLQ